MEYNAVVKIDNDVITLTLISKIGLKEVAVSKSSDKLDIRNIYSVVAELHNYLLKQIED
jgi:hypothetical protein